MQLRSTLPPEKVGVIGSRVVVSRGQARVHLAIQCTLCWCWLRAKVGKWPLHKLAVVSAAEERFGDAEWSR